MSKKTVAKHIKLKRAYEAPATDDGTRILIDRLWPRGVKRSDAAIDEWMKEIAPSTELRRWFSHDPCRWQELAIALYDPAKHRSLAKTPEWVPWSIGPLPFGCLAIPMMH